MDLTSDDLVTDIGLGNDLASPAQPVTARPRNLDVTVEPGRPRPTETRRASGAHGGRVWVFDLVIAYELGGAWRAYAGVLDDRGDTETVHVDSTDFEMPPVGPDAIATAVVNGYFHRHPEKLPHHEIDRGDRVDAGLESSMLEEHVVNPVTYPPMTWDQSLEWLLAHGYDTAIYPTMMSGGCVDPQSVRSTLALLAEHRRLYGEAGGPSRPPLDGHGGLGVEERYVIETGLNGHEREVAWVYESTVPMDEWHELHTGSEYYLEPGAEEPAEYPWSHWPHILLGVRREEPG